jgi:hypothetical protein
MLRNVTDKEKIMPLWPFGKSSFRTRAPLAKGDARHASCSFCGRPPQAVGPMVEGPNLVYICAHCAKISADIAEGNRSLFSPPDLNDPKLRLTGHMHFLCYFHLQQETDGRWNATGEGTNGAVGTGSTPREAVHNLQTRILSEAAEAFATDAPVGDHFANHADKRLR